jgi:probable F420-dependent oxidoreductase
MRISSKVPNSGPLPAALGIGPMAARLEAAGFDGLWCSDHIVMPAVAESYYPFGDDGKVSWDPQMPWYDAVVAMTMTAAATARAEVGVAVLVLPLRQPVTFAKQVASIDALTGGRMALGVGAGWLAEEVEALGVDYATRGARLDEWMTLLRDCWTGFPAPRDGAHYTLPDGVIVQPTPLGKPPILVGGTSKVALRRAGRSGDGWLGLQRAGHLDPDALRPSVGLLRREAGAAGRDPARLRVPLRVIESAGRADVVAAALPALAAAGVDEVIVDTSWDGDGDEVAVHDRLRAAAT